VGTFLRHSVHWLRVPKFTAPTARNTALDLEDLPPESTILATPDLYQVLAAQVRVPTSQVQIPVPVPEVQVVPVSASTSTLPQLSFADY